MSSLREPMDFEIGDSIPTTSHISRFRETEWKRVLGEEGLPEWVIANIRPLLKKVEAFTSCDLPRYIIRVWSDRSAGSNCENGERKFWSQAARGGLGATAFKLMPPEELQDNLSKHLKWDTGTRNTPFHSHWISFTSSILFALVHAWRKANDHPLTRAYNIKDPRIEDSLYGEILAYDNFEAEMDVISFSALLRPRPDFPDPRPGFPESRPPGLLDLCAFLKYNEAEMKEAEEQACRSKDKRLGLKSRMKKFRERRFGDFEVLQVKPQDRRVKAVHKWTLQQGKCAGPFPMSPWELKDFYRLVKPFKPDFRLPMLVSLLSLMTRKWKQDSMEEQVIHKIQEEETSIRVLVFYHTGYVSPMLPELRMFQEMMENIYLGLRLAVSKGSQRDQRPLLNTDLATEAANNLASESEIYYYGSDSSGSEADLEEERISSHDREARAMGRRAYSEACRWRIHGILFHRSVTARYYQSHQYAVDGGHLCAVGDDNQICTDPRPIGCFRSRRPTYGWETALLLNGKSSQWVWIKDDLWLSIEAAAWKWEGWRFKDRDGNVRFVPSCLR